jgi:ATP-dependent HslUV protease ATP-binding subunit HslU
LPELQGRLPIRVELRALKEEDFVRILTETDNALTRQYTALMETEGVTVTFTEDGIAALAASRPRSTSQVENIGARRLYTVMERVFEDSEPSPRPTAPAGMTRPAPLPAFGQMAPKI